MGKIRNKKEIECSDEILDLIWEVELKRIAELLLLTMTADTSPITHTTHWFLGYGFIFLLCSNVSMKREPFSW